MGETEELQDLRRIGSVNFEKLILEQLVTSIANYYGDRLIR